MLHRKSFWLLCFISLILPGITNKAFSQIWNPGHAVGTVTGKYHYAYNQVADQMVELATAGWPSVGQNYQWESSTTPNEADFVAVTPNGSQYSSYSPGAITQTRYYRRKTTNMFQLFIYSNIVKISLVSANWEDRNYIREHDVQVTGITNWQAVDQLPIGQKLQTTTYMDGLGRSVQKVSRETATPAQAGGLWGDIVQFSEYDALGRQPKKYLPYTTTAESGKFKTATGTQQPLYYTSVYNETAAFSTITFDNSPLNRITNIKGAGTAWAASTGNSASYDMNSPADNVQKFSVDYGQGTPPVNNGAYPANTLYKVTSIDENGKQVVEFLDKKGQTILKKVQLDDAPSAAHNGWICTYNIVDDWGLLRYELPPEAVKYLDANNWSFAGTNGQQVLNELCTQYNYDDKGRNIWKKNPGAAPLNMIFDTRNRLVFGQDGNQAALSTPQWTAYLYDALDRPVITTLYNTTKSIAALQTDANNSVTLPVSNAISTADLNNSSICTIVKYLFYDDYSFAGAKPFNSSFTNLSAYNNSDPNVVQIAWSKRTISKATGSMTRVLGTNTFLYATHYFDENGDVIQTLKDNIKTGTDITTLQYHFDGRVLSSCVNHTAPGTDYSNFITLTKYNFDILGRVTSIQKQYGSNAFKTISSYDYDDAGRVKTKRLDPDYIPPSGGNGLETLDYSFNLHNQLTGINKDYALKNPSNYNKWGHFFGMYLGYDNRDNVFTRSRLNGQLTGVVWNTQGDDAQRRYDYTYDNADRLENAVFTEQQRPGEGWTSNKMDFSVTGTSGKITYDLNGNLLNMLQKGVQPGNAAPLTVDNLTYTYASWSNKLQSVTDQMTTPGINGNFGDFKDGSNGSAADYVYDNNGNMVVDLNKNAKDLGNIVGANGISYNFLDKPEQIRIAGKGTIKIVYSANGEKLQRIFTPESGTAMTTTYINQFTYQATGGNPDELSFISFEEGRIRVMQPTTTQDANGYDALAIGGNMTLPNGKAGVYDYFIMDYQQNVRMVLTEGTHNAFNTCTMETGSRASVEEPVFGQSGGGNEVHTTRYPKPAGWDNGDVVNSVSRLGNIAGHNIGPNTLQKVMAGDQVSASALYYYQSATGGSNPNLINTLLTSLGQAITGGGAAGGLVKGNVSGVTSGLNGTSGFINAAQPAGSGGTTPKAYLTILFFDERFKFIEAADGGVWQQQVAASVGSSGLPLAGSIKAPKNGYVYVYISNESDQDVYFDNLKVGIARGNIIEENHYYSYGLKIAAISSRKSGDVNEGLLKNNYQFQGDYNEFDDDISWNDFALRNYDPQIGRWIQQDPYEEFPSPYLGMGNDPVNSIDPSGGSILSGLTIAGRLAVTTITGAFIGGAADGLSGGDGWKGAGIGAGAGLVAGLGSLGWKIAATLGINSVNAFTTVTRSTMVTFQVGTPNTKNVTAKPITSYGSNWDPKNVHDLGHASYAISGSGYNFDGKTFTLIVSFNIVYNGLFSTISVYSIEKENPGLFKETEAHETSHVDQYIEAALSHDVSYKYDNTPYTGAADIVLGKIRVKMFEKLGKHLQQEAKSGKYKTQKEFDKYQEAKESATEKEFKKIVNNILDQMQKFINDKFDLKGTPEQIKAKTKAIEDDANVRALKKLKGKAKYLNGFPVRYKGRNLPSD